ncbi:MULTISPECIES: UDP-N-acetylglucosamine 4,6-dehydratase [unclassified Oceanispirochaeta]|uniref:UDP-N-acetylglucosamine 4,6-dehydratase n=1 Tax=unclassified Oceanispirochaeta TaxID=2635722 RepID=UPI000E09669A|nr:MULTISPECIES: UDP-N-acetylglucosamine 4,6-dehydratase [unclassified Oceanispirochaeta]MBF9017754.1 UDP-N-acetylglucosamine 4,6-dehydratase [Oceanispirochaeta sp. M2]NPD74318.1 UDP-N-acetylglucosamine 4,6-dehydratase [Oceanispirochaeta sp. M1]RDG29799.1 NAD-dependent epimerase/dehydratase family protein [Oceanispirochaeta sp. M1]
MNLLSILNRENQLLEKDIKKNIVTLNKRVSESSFLVIGGAGSIGQAVAKEIFQRNPKRLHVVDISENNLVELVRDIRSSYGYIDGDFKTFALDCGSREFELLFENEGPYDYVLNLSALKHVRSEKDPYTLMRMIDVNVLNTIKTIDLSIKHGVKKYFCVSTDKAANPVNMMGASKRIMEMFLMQKSIEIDISTARFANVAFSDGSLLYGFNQRILKKQPLSAPNDVRRYFVLPEEAGQLCLFSTILGENRDIFFPKLSQELNLITFSSIAERYLSERGFDPYLCDSENEARELVSKLSAENKWPCYFFKSDTTGEKDFEEFFTEKETLDMNQFIALGVIKNNPDYNEEKLSFFLKKISDLKDSGWNKKELLELFYFMIPDFGHKETGKYLDGRM